VTRKILFVQLIVIVVQMNTAKKKPAIVQVKVNVYKYLMHVLTYGSLFADVMMKHMATTVKLMQQVFQQHMRANVRLLLVNIMDKLITPETLLMMTVTHVSVTRMDRLPVQRCTADAMMVMKYMEPVKTGPNI